MRRRWSGRGDATWALARLGDLGVEDGDAFAKDMFVDEQDSVDLADMDTISLGEVEKDM